MPWACGAGLRRAELERQLEQHFLRYLDELASLYSAKLKTVGLESTRGFLTARRAG